MSLLFNKHSIVWRVGIEVWKCSHFPVTQSWQSEVTMHTSFFSPFYHSVCACECACDCVSLWSSVSSQLSTGLSTVKFIHHSERITLHVRPHLLPTGLRKVPWSAAACTSLAGLCPCREPRLSLPFHHRNTQITDKYYHIQSMCLLGFELWSSHRHSKLFHLLTHLPNPYILAFASEWSC